MTLRLRYHVPCHHGTTLLARAQAPNPRLRGTLRLLVGLHDLQLVTVELAIVGAVLILVLLRPVALNGLIRNGRVRRRN